eukprot:356842-Chlamydomonas_euryale.AAC.3
MVAAESARPARRKTCGGVSGRFFLGGGPGSVFFWPTLAYTRTHTPWLCAHAGRLLPRAHPPAPAPSAAAAALGPIAPPAGTRARPRRCRPPRAVRVPTARGTLRGSRRTRTPITPRGPSPEPARPRVGEGRERRSRR